MKKIFPVLAAAALLTSSCGDNQVFLPRMSEISNLEIVQVIGIDLIDGKVTVTLVISRGDASGEEGQSSATSVTIASFFGDTVYEAISQMNIYSDRRLHLGYVDFLIIGEDAARDDITKYLDFLLRDNETRYTVQVFLARGATAREFLTKTATVSRNTVEMLSNLEETISELNNTRITTLIELLNDLGTARTSAVIPALELKDAGFAENIGGEMPENVFAPAGFGIISKHRLVEYIDDGLAGAYNCLTKHVHVMPISVSGPDGNKVAMKIVVDKLIFKPDWDGETLKGVKYSILIGAKINEQGGHMSIFNEDTLTELESQVARLMKNKFDQVIETAQKAGEDSLGIGDRLRMKNPLKWLKISDNWDELFAQLPIFIETQCQIRRSHDMREAVAESGAYGEKND